MSIEWLKSTNIRKLSMKVGIPIAVGTYAIVSLYAILRIFYELFFTPIYFISRDYELALIVALLNVFCFLPLFISKLRLRLLKLNLLIAAFAYFLIFVLGATDLPRFWARPLEVSDRLSRADAIIVLDTGYVEDRFVYGAELYKQGYADTLVTFMPKELNTFLGKRNGVPSENIFHLSGGANTYWQAVVAKKFFEERGWKKGILVTVSYHMLRARKAFDKQRLKVLSAPIPDSLWYSQPGRFINDRNFRGKKMADYGLWDRFKIRHTWAMQMLHEYTGLVYYYLRSYI